MQRFHAQSKGAFLSITVLVMSQAAKQAVKNTHWLLVENTADVGGAWSSLCRLSVTVSVWSYVHVLSHHSHLSQQFIINGSFFGQSNSFRMLSSVPQVDTSRVS